MDPRSLNCRSDFYALSLVDEVNILRSEFQWVFFISNQVGDRTGELTAEMNIVDLKSVLGIDVRRFVL